MAKLRGEKSQTDSKIERHVISKMMKYDATNFLKKHAHSVSCHNVHLASCLNEKLILRLFKTKINLAVSFFGSP